MTEVRPSAPPSPGAPAPAYIGPLLREEAVWLRYGAAVAIVLLVAGIRALLAPLLGTQAPLLPFVLGVFGAAYLGGRGPATLASLLTPLLATFWFTNWPHDAPASQWLAHVLFFLVIALLSGQLMHELQMRSRAEREALVIAAQHAQALSRADRRKDEFLAMLAHELRNPLAPIRNAGYLLTKGQIDPGTVRRSGQMIERQANHLSRLVDDLLDVARISRGRVVLECNSVSLDSLADGALETVRPMLHARGQTAVVRRDAERVYVFGDSVRLCQVVTNLLTNASKYSPERSSIEILIESSAADATLAVRDQGIGIDAQLLPFLFDPFQQGDRTLDRSQGGLGLGLTIVKLLVELHGGEVSAHSNGLGKGAEFRIRLPRVSAAGQSMSPSAAENRAPARPRRVLIIEDNVDAAESMRAVLRMEQHEVEVVHDGAAGLAMLEDFRADIVVLDIGLPRMDGYMVAHAIRERFALVGRRPKLLALTGYGGSEDRAAAIKAGFDVHLAKPVDPQMLLQIVSEEVQTQTASRHPD